jgi:hypothetical protein
VLKVKISSKGASDINHKGLGALTRMKNLLEFYFDFEWVHSHERKAIFNLFLQYMPRLQVVQNFIRIDGGCQDPWTERSESVDFSKIGYRQINLGLRQLLLRSSAPIPSSVALPNLESLILCYGFINFSPDSRFSSVAELGLRDLTMTTITGVLKHLGLQLRILYISQAKLEGADEPPLNLNCIFTNCQNLEALHLTEYFEVVCTEDFNSHERLKKLRALSIATSTQDEKMVIGPHALHKLLLSAPNLQAINIGYHDLSQEEVDEVSSSLQKRAILQHIGFLFFCCSDDLRLKKGYEALLDLMVQLCPRLLYLFVDVDHVALST